MGPIRSRPQHVDAVHTVTCTVARCVLSGSPGNARPWLANARTWYWAAPRDGSVYPTLAVTWALSSSGPAFSPQASDAWSRVAQSCLMYSCTLVHTMRS